MWAVVAREACYLSGFEPCVAYLVVPQLDDLFHLGQQISNLARLLEDRLRQDDCE